MKALLISDNDELHGDIKALLERNGFECSENDIASFDHAVEHLGQARRDLVVVMMSPNPVLGMEMVRDVRNMTEGTIVAIGPANDPKFLLRVLHEGADDYVDQAEVESELQTTLVNLKVKRLTHEACGRIVGVLSTAGGCGASTVAANLAVSLAQASERTLVFDLRLAAGDQSLLYDLRPKHSLADLCRHITQMDQSVFLRCLESHPSGVHLLASPCALEDIPEITPQAIRQVLSMARTIFPFVIMDLDGSFNSEQVAAMLRADLLLLVMRLDMTSLRNTRRILDHLERLGMTADRIRVVVNRYGQPRELSARQVEQALGIKVFHYIRNDPRRINTANNNGVPVVLDRPYSRISKSMKNLATSVSNVKPTPRQNNNNNSISSHLSAIHAAAETQSNGKEGVIAQHG